MKKLLLALLLAATTALGQTDTIKFRTDTHQVKKPPVIGSGVDYDFTGLNVVGIAGGGGGGGTSTPGGSASQLQYNNGGTAFGGVPQLTYDGTAVFLKGGTQFNLTDGTDTSKRIQFNIAGISGTKIITFPNLTGTVMMADNTTPPTAGHIIIASSASTVTNGDLNGAVTTSGSTTTAIASNAVTTTNILDGSVTIPKLADMSGGGVVIGRMPPGTGPPAEVTTLNWDTAYTDRLKWDGGPTGLVAATGRGSLGATTIGTNFFTATNPSALTYLRVNVDNSLSFLAPTPFKAALAITPSDIVGATTVGSNLITLANPSAITFLKVNADNTVATETATTHLTSLGGTTVGRGILTAPNPSAITFLRVNADNSVSLLSNTTFKVSLALTSSDVGLSAVTNDAQIKASDFPASVTAGQIVTFNGTTGKSVQATSFSGMLKATSGVLQTATLGTDYWNGNTFSGTVGSNTKGLVPDPGPVSGTGARFLRDDGLWVASGSLTDADKGDITVSGGGTSWTIDTGVVTYAKMQTVNAQVLLGRTSFGPGAPQEISVGSGLQLLGTTLSATGGGGGGNVSNSGTPTADQAAVWTDATHVKGVTTQKGGASGTYLKKNSATDYDWVWATPTISSVVDPSDSSKILNFNISGFNTGTTRNLVPAAGADSVTVIPSTIGLTGVNGPFYGQTAKGIGADGNTWWGYPDIGVQAMTVAGNKDNWNLSSSGGNYGYYQRWSDTAGNVNVTGIAPPNTVTNTHVDGEAYIVTNVGAANTFTLKHQVTSTAANQFYCETGADIVLSKDQSAYIVYDGILNRHRVRPLPTSSSGGGITALTGDVTASGTGSVAATIASQAVTYGKMQNVTATSRFLGRISAGAGSPEELTGTQATTFLDAFTSSLKGLVPSSGGGTTNFLRADGIWAAPAGGGGGSPPGGSVNSLQYQVNSTTFGGVNTYTTDGTTITGGASGVLNLSAQTGVNSLLLPSIVSGAPTTAGAILFEPNQQQIRMGTSTVGRYLATRDGGETLANKTLDNTNNVSQYLTFTNMAAPTTPATGKTKIYTDSTSKNFAAKNDTGAVNHGIQSKTAVAGQFITGIADDGTTTTAAAATNAFGTIAVSGQTNVVAAAAPDTVNYVAGTGMTITTTPATNTVTFTTTSGGGNVSNNTTNTFTSAGTLDLSASSGSNGLVVPNSTGVGTGTTVGAISFNTSGNTINVGNGTTSIQVANRNTSNAFSSAATVDLSALSVTGGLTMPQAAGAAPVSAGVVAYDNTAKQLKHGDGTTTQTIVDRDTTETLTHKTLDSLRATAGTYTVVMNGTNTASTKTCTGSDIAGAITLAMSSVGNVSSSVCTISGFHWTTAPSAIAILPTNGNAVTGQSSARLVVPGNITTTSFDIMGGTTGMSTSQTYTFMYLAVQ